MAPTIKITYFDITGKAELLRLILSAGNMDFEDIRVKKEDWPALKPTAPFGQLPTMEYDGEIYAQTNAMAKFLAKKAGLAGNDDLEELKMDMFMEFMNDIFSKLMGVFAKSESDKDAAGKKLFEEELPAMLKTLETHLEKNGGKFLVGDTLSYVDIAYFDLLQNLTWEDHPFFPNLPHNELRLDILKDHPSLVEHMERVKEHPGVLSWLDKRPTGPK
ncbi:hypothetical protein TCAL_08357 [Tigriopus californicus]|uniref:glutathione transferase n=3 Tax=Tigriopus californicus TaxID=6832 RepID=A0A553PF74_TIGCA|nr:hypothetical protein TCAL_08357 [Tigriopus californicus]|eukprot:TCALIF_08357-PA protein Name:"Similar to GST1 Glutathione S-transferase 1 (Ascaris suum)" AED:0.40 eAED:0.40 QI:209/1/1/1/1/1/3/40/216